MGNKCFINHRYYYKRTYKEDIEMLKELFLFMKEDSLIFAFKDNKPVAFVMWYPDYNELAVPGEVFGSKHFFKNKKARQFSQPDFFIGERISHHYKQLFFSKTLCTHRAIRLPRRAPARTSVGK